MIFLLTFTGTASTTNSTSNFYVDVNHGNDQSAGSLTHPWKSINHAALKVKPGNTVHISSGNSVNISKTIKGNLLTITPKILLSKTTRYTIILHSGCVKDSLNHGLSLYTSNFKTRT